MQTPIQKIAIVGVGAVGGVFAGLLGADLANKKIQLSALARGHSLDVLRREGLTWVDAHEVTHHVPLTVSDNPADLGPQDLVIVAVKGPAMPSVAASVRSLLAPHTMVLVAMNGIPWWFFDGLGGACDGLTLPAVDPEGVTAQHIPTSHVLGCVVLLFIPFF